MKKSVFFYITIVLIVAGLLITTLFYVLRGQDTGACVENGKKYKEFEINPSKTCQCEGPGNGLDKLMWVCKGG